MKKFILILFFSVFLLTGCFKTENAELKKYREACNDTNEAACAKYLFIESWINVKEMSFTTNLDKQDWAYWKNRYLDNLEKKEDAFVAIDTMLASLDDPYTRFLTPKELEEQNMDINAKLTGIGVLITTINGKITVIDVFENSPAEKIGMKAKDVILKVGEISVSGLPLENASNLIRGEKGTKVSLEVLRDNEVIKLDAIRDVVIIKAVKQKMLEGNISYIKLSTFMSHSTSAEFVEAMMKSTGAKAMIIDLRGNPGGLLQNATYIANLLLKEGTIVSIHKKDNVSETIKVQHIHNNIQMPIVVLTNGLSASAGEILAAALQENGRAKIVGEKTFGKGLIQKIAPLPMDTAMNVTIAKYLTPQGHDINKNGIKPDYEVKMTMDDLLKGKDPQLEKAVELLK